MHGCCVHGDPVGIKSNKKINELLRREKKKLESEVKLLLLGAGESGKSTIAKQMKIIHLTGFTEKERETYRAIIFNNIISSMRALITAASEFDLSLSQTNLEAAARLNTDDSEGYFSGPLTTDLIADIKELWGDPAIQATYARASEFQLTDSSSYYFNAMDRISPEGYIPTEQDILRSRAKTTGIIEIEFDVEQVHFRMVDVGGQRSERKKWIHCFQDVTSVIFCVALSEYDLKLYEDDTTNRMHESLRLFKEICHSEWFGDTAIILFLNKRDLFEDKIRKVDLSICFQEYKGGKNFECATQYIHDQFLAQNENSDKPVYTHLTCATDTGNITVVFNAVKDIVLRKALNNAGIV